ncbi:alkaline phosphatase family protein [Bartonella sp. HY329]|uniref:alkaline phosphatase family protein n=1 Tax=unclassified Bartonella TaxID=2645622 RepID=UPI0021C6887A|nr:MULTISPECIES: alkaline phosphatase family protein [unclassified Bartonella]UXM94496.1 alkaline phosphatase family protein [Bartonella sp. HY329]UXN08820.1 alkaline phosphatase family protein [Bartonella sp. HY328]
MSKLILVVLDGLRYDTARECLGYLEGLIDLKRGNVTKLRCELPAMSRPLYETLLTGRSPADHGVVSNAIVRRSNGDNIFALCRKSNLTTAAAAYYWVSELYVNAPFDYKKDRILIDQTKDINYGVFYWDDSYPDSHLFADAQNLINRFSPEFLLLHPMNIDDAGHKSGGNSVTYRNNARKAGDLLAQYMPNWLEQGYKVIVTADHGMGDDGNHSGPLPSESEVPFYWFGFDMSVEALRQTEIAALCCAVLGVDAASLTSFSGKLA